MSESTVNLPEALGMSSVASDEDVKKVVVVDEAPHLSAGAAALVMLANLGRSFGRKGGGYPGYSGHQEFQTCEMRPEDSVKPVKKRREKWNKMVG